jgi:hypothetical protein
MSTSYSKTKLCGSKKKLRTRNNPRDQIRPPPEHSCWSGISIVTGNLRDERMACTCIPEISSPWDSFARGLARLDDILWSVFYATWGERFAYMGFIGGGMDSGYGQCCYVYICRAEPHKGWLYEYTNTNIHSWIQDETFNRAIETINLPLFEMPIIMSLIFARVCTFNKVHL